MLQSPHASSKVVERVECVRCVIVVCNVDVCGPGQKHDASEEPRIATNEVT